MIITNANIILEDKIIRGDVYVEGDKIVKIKRTNKVNKKADYNLEGNYLAPGFVDIHNHGGYGYDYMDNTEEAFKQILRFHADNGITSAIASTVTAPPETTIETCNVARKIKGKKGAHAKLLGVHLEGPYLSMQNKGAHNPDLIRVPATDDYGYILENADIIKHITISPELEGTAELTKKLVDKGVVVSMGHDNAILPEIVPVVEAGATNLTHIYCAMSGVIMKDNVRYVGLREYGLINDNLTAEVIADNHHITPEIFKMLFRCKGADTLCLISDCLRAGGMKMDGKLYSLGAKDDPTSMQFKVADGVAVLADGSRYAGSIQPISRMLKNVVFDADVSIVDGIKMVSITPAKIVGEDNNIGSIKVGKQADFNVLDKDLNVLYTIIDGQLYK